MNYNNIIDPTKRYDFMLVFDVQNGNPNGDPDAGNLPRVDPESMQGLVTDVSIKRKIRDYAYITREGKETFDIYVKHRGILTHEQQKAYESLELEDNESEDAKINARQWMCNHYYDVRMFGAVMSTKKFNAGQVKGPIQFTFARSVDPIFPYDLTITRVGLTNATDIKSGKEDDKVARSGQMGRKAIVPYGLYVAYGFYTPSFAEKTGVREEDLQLLWEALVNMWDFDHSAARGLMACRGLYVFSHDSKYGNSPSQHLFEKVSIKSKGEGSPRSHRDYEVWIDETLPEGVALNKVVHTF